MYIHDLELGNTYRSVTGLLEGFQSDETLTLVKIQVVILFSHVLMPSNLVIVISHDVNKVTI